MVLRKIRESPITGGTATFAETANFPELIFSSKKLLRNIGWIGIATPEFKIDPRDNVPKLMEINPRFFGYTNLAISAGLDLPYILYNSFKGNSLMKYHIYYLSFSRLLHDIFSLYKGITESGLTFRQRTHEFNEFIKTYKKQKIIFDYFSFKDIKPFFFSFICIIGREINLVRKPYEKMEKKW
jgi:predicted ATP-grasp superfamily ATP-dependent carboligase